MGLRDHQVFRITYSYRKSWSEDGPHHSSHMAYDPNLTEIETLIVAPSEQYAKVWANGKIKFLLDAKVDLIQSLGVPEAFIHSEVY